MSTTLIASSTALPSLGTVPSGQSAPLEVIDAQHHGAWVTITTAIGLTLGLVCLFIRTLIAFAALHLHLLAHGISSLNPSLDLVGPVIWAQIELHYSNIAATVPCLKPFMAAVSTNYGATEPGAMSQGGSRGYGSSSAKRKGSSYVLSSMSKDRNSSNLDSKGGIFRAAKRGAYKMNSESFGASQSTNGHVVVQQGKAKQDSNSIGSNDSRKMIIKKEVNIRVERDGGSQPDEELGIEPVGAGRAI
ncbi:MAG: hypothetical protein Q9191_004790 [Dirinaria sp. TL-2023a]